VVAGLLGQIREQLPEVGVGIAQPAGLRAEAEQGLQHRQGDQFGVGQLGHDPDCWPPRRQVRSTLQQVVDLHVPCGGEGVQGGVHRASKGLDVGLATPILDTLLNIDIRGPWSHQGSDPLESII
jgi:hypothetical protein